MSNKNKPQIALIYEAYIQEENKKNVDERYVGNEKFFHASGANMCMRKHWYQTHKAPVTNPSSITGNRIMRLGTVVHNDYENALKWHQNLEKSPNHILDTIKTISSIRTIRTEGEIQIPEYNVRGFYDAVFEMETGEVYLYDFKTIRSYPYKLKFGRNPNPGKIKTHEIQLATYGLAVKEKYGRLDGMFLYYYNKDSSVCKEFEVSMSYLDQAKDYWERVNEDAVGLTPPPVDNIDSPVQGWECGYCNYEIHCNDN